MNILSTLIAADGGEVEVAGHDVAREPDVVRVAIGVTGQFSAVDSLLTDEENLILMGGEIGSRGLIAVGWCVVITLVGYLWATRLYERDPAR